MISTFKTVLRTGVMAAIVYGIIYRFPSPGVVELGGPNGAGKSTDLHSALARVYNCSICSSKRARSFTRSSLTAKHLYQYQ